MHLRSGKVTTTDEYRPKKRNTRKMASSQGNPRDSNPHTVGSNPQSSNSNALNSSVNPEDTSRSEVVPTPVPSTGGPTAPPVVSESIPPTAGLGSTYMRAYTQPVMEYIGPSVSNPQTPLPPGTSTFRHFPPPGFSQPLPRNPPYGMPTSGMQSLQNAAPVFSENVLSSPLQGSGSGINLGRNSQSLGVGYSA